MCVCSCVSACAQAFVNVSGWAFLKPIRVNPFSFCMPSGPLLFAQRLAAPATTLPPPTLELGITQNLIEKLTRVLLEQGGFRIFS